MTGTTAEASPDSVPVTSTTPATPAPTTESKIVDRRKRLELLREFTPQEIVDAIVDYKFTHEVYEIRAALAKQRF